MDAKLGRKPRAIPRRSRHIYIREDVVATVDLVLLDPMRDKVKYGKWSDLVEALLLRWIKEQRSGNLRIMISPEDVKRLQDALRLLEGINPDQPLLLSATLTEAIRLIKEALK